MNDSTSTVSRNPLSARPTWHRILVRPESMTLLLLVFGLVGASILSPFFLDANYILRSFTLTAEMAVVALTIGTLIFYRGLAQVIAGDSSIRLPESFIGINNVMVFGVPLPVVIGTFLAAWLLVIVSTGMTVANLLPAIQLTVLGILLIVAIIATNFIYAQTQR